MMCENAFEFEKKIVHMIDPKHVMKKLRNNVLSSGFGDNFKRTLVVQGHHVVWEHWKATYYWDKMNNLEMQHLQ